MTVAAKPRMAFHSRPYEKRIALIPMSIALSLFWALGIFAVIIASVLLKFGGAIEFLRILLVIALLTYLAIVTLRWISQSNLTYDLKIENDLIELIVNNLRSKRSESRKIALAEIESAEYFTPRDSASLYLKGRRTTLELPLWAFGPVAEQEIISFFRAHNIPLISIP